MVLEIYIVNINRHESGGCDTTKIEYRVQAFKDFVNETCSLTVDNEKLKATIPVPEEEEAVKELEDMDGNVNEDEEELKEEIEDIKDEAEEHVEEKDEAEGNQENEKDEQGLVDEEAWDVETIKEPVEEKDDDVMKEEAIPKNSSTIDDNSTLDPLDTSDVLTI
ncbi:hypothetical protein [Bacillus sp. AK031]